MTLPSGMNKTTVEQGGKKTRKSKAVQESPLPAAQNVKTKATEVPPPAVQGEKKTPKPKAAKESPRPEHFSTLGLDTFGKRLDWIRRVEGLTKNQLGERLQGNQSYLSQMLHDKRNPSRTMINKIADTFDLNSEWLATGAGEPKRPPQYPPEFSRAIEKANEKYLRCTTEEERYNWLAHFYRHVVEGK
jgi:transcriptional regulator with XRE-family HTH domain